MTRTRTRDLGAGLALAIGLAAPSVHAEIVEFTYHASIFFIDEIDYEGDEFDLELGETVSMRYVIDLETPDLRDSPAFGRYELIGLSLEIDGTVGHANVPGFLDTDISGSFDEFDTAGSGFFGEDNGGLRMGGTDALLTDAIPVGFEMASFSARFIDYGFFSPAGGAVGFRAQIHEYEMNVIPGGGGAIALIVGCLTLRGRRRRHPASSERSSRWRGAIATHTHTGTCGDGRQPARP